MAATQDTANTTSSASTRSAVLRASRAFGVTALGVAAVGAVCAGTMGAASAKTATAAATTNTVAHPSSYGYPDATNAGVPSGTTLKSVPAQVSSGPGWSYNASSGNVVVTGNGAVLSNLNISSNLDVQASNVTIQNVKVSASGNFGISLRHASGVKIENSSVDGQNATTGRLNYAVDDIFGDSAGATIQGNEISNFRTGLQITTGTVSGNYIHDPGYVSGDHTNGVYTNGGTQPLTIKDNTILNSMGQTDAINLDAGNSGVATANKTVENNLLSGGSYTIYAGNTLGNPTSNIVIQGNRFAQNYYPTSGQYGPGVYFDHTAAGNSWSGNVWDGTGLTIPAP
jgi:hypothetical protein